MASPNPTVPSVDQLSIATPADWWVLPLDPRTRDRRIARLVQSKMGKDDRLAHVRLPLVTKLRKFVRAAAEQGAFFAAIHSRVTRGAPLAATLLASWRSSVTDEEGVPLLGAEDMMAALSPSTEGGEVLERSLVDLPVGQAVRVRRRAVSDIQDKDGNAIQGESVDFFVPLPEISRTLILFFATPIIALADDYAALFDTMARTVTLVSRPHGDQPR